MNLLVINGFDLNTLARREPKTFTPELLVDFDGRVREHAGDLGATVEIFRSNNESELVNFIQQHRASADGIIINPGDVLQASVALRDCLVTSGAPVIELQMSKDAGDDAAAHDSVIAPIARGKIAGLGLRSYMLAISFFAREYPSK
jgi:3-dehydroquinate dehydratase-2